MPKRWTTIEDSLLKNSYPDASREEVKRLLKGRSWKAIQNRATRLNILRAEAPIYRFKRKIKQIGDCWVWTDILNSSGYGNFYANGKTQHAHQFAFEFFKGPPNDDQEIDHLCRNRACVNPQHLEAVSHQENVARGMAPPAVNGNKTHCQNGHLFSDDNTRITSGRRVCKTCSKKYQRQYYINKSSCQPTDA